MKSLASQMRIYQSYHQKTFTKLTHVIGIPLAILPFLMLLNWVHLLIPNLLFTPLSWPVTLALMVYYLRLDWQLGGVLCGIFFILNFLSLEISGFAPTWLGFLWVIVIFVLAWTLQLIGHAVEGKRPALTDNLFQVFIAPLFLVAEIAFYFGLKQKLKKELSL